MGDERRRTPRIAAGWQARYTLDDRPGDGWYDCRVIDISLGGAGLELFGPAPLPDAGVRVELSVSAPAARFQLPAETRNMGPSTHTGIRVGVEWHALTRAQHDLLRLILKLTHRRAARRRDEAAADRLRKLSA